MHWLCTLGFHAWGERFLDRRSIGLMLATVYQRCERRGCNEVRAEVVAIQR